MYYSIYYMTTPRCILNCGYCFRDTTPESIASELPVEKIKELVTHLYEKFHVRKLTISGGEPTVLGGVKNTNFLELIRHLRQFKSESKEDNLRVELLSNAVNLTPDITEQLVGVVDRIAITLDSLDETVLSKIGRNMGPYRDYVSRFRERIGRCRSGEPLPESGDSHGNSGKNTDHHVNKPDSRLGCEKRCISRRTHDDEHDNHTVNGLRERSSGEDQQIHCLINAVCRRLTSLCLRLSA